MDNALSSVGPMYINLYHRLTVLLYWRCAVYIDCNTNVQCILVVVNTVQHFTTTIKCIIHVCFMVRQPCSITLMHMV